VYKCKPNLSLKRKAEIQLHKHNLKYSALISYIFVVFQNFFNAIHWKVWNNYSWQNVCIEAIMEYDSVEKTFFFQLLIHLIETFVTFQILWLFNKLVLWCFICMFIDIFNSE